MDFDVKGNLSAVKRSVSLLERDKQPACMVTLSRNYTTTVSDLWDAVTNSQRIPRWFLPISGKLEPDSHYQLEGNAGGVITACERPSHFSITWEFSKDVSWVEVRLLGDGNSRTRLTLTHTMHLSEHWDKYGPGATGVGWELALMGLAIHITQPTVQKPDETAFATSQNGKAFITGSSERWGQAAIATGTDPETASAAAKRTTMFYTGEPAEST